LLKIRRAAAIFAKGMAIMSSTTSPHRLFGRIWALPWKSKLAVVIGAPVGAFYIGALALNAFNYSDGYRTGVVSKLSSKGFACWTTEGQLAQMNFSRSSDLRAPKNAPVDNTFYFSVPDADIRKQLENIEPGSAVSLEYRQKLFALDWPLPFLCKRRTQYEIVGVKAAANPPGGAEPMAPLRP
jgi:hypothetical protein